MSQPLRTALVPADAELDAFTDPEVGPVGAAAIAFLFAILTVIVFRLTGAPGWIVLAAQGVLTAALVYHARGRQPRALSARSVVFRAAAATTCGQWIFWNVVDVAGGWRPVAALTAQIVIAATVAAVTWMVGVRGHAWKWAGAIIAGVIVVGEVALYAAAGSFGAGAGTWIVHVLTVTVPVPHGFWPYLHFLWPVRVTSAGVLAAAAAIVGHRLANHEAAEDQQRRAALYQRPQVKKITSMQSRVTAVTLDAEVVVTDCKDWKRAGAGETYMVDFSRTNLDGWEAFNSLCGPLASRMHLPNGCGVEAGPGTRNGEVCLYVSRLNLMADLHPYPRGLRPRTILDPIPAGVLRPGDQAGLRLRENSLLVVGQKGSGKTHYLQCLMAGLGQCRDTLIWVIDYNHGGVALNYLRAFAEGRARRPMIDWVATTPAEALIMVETGLAIFTDRKAFYVHKKWDADTNLMPVSPDVPQIIIVVDEGAEVTGDTGSGTTRQVSETLQAIMRLARDAGGNIVFSSLRAVSDSIPTAMQVGCAARVGLRVTDKGELGYLFGDYKLDIGQITEQGSGFIQADHDTRARVVKGHYLAPSGMDEIAVAVEGWRPYLDARGRAVAGAEYTDRWRRNTDLLTLLGRGHLHIDLDVDPDAGAAGGPAPAAAHPTPPAASSPSTVAAPATAAGAPVFDERAARQPFDLPEPTSSVDILERLAALAAGAPSGDLPQAPPSFDDAAPAAPAAVGERAEPAPPPAPGGPTTAGRETLRKLIWMEGPIGRSDIHKKLTAGGDWGPPVEVSWTGLDNWLKAAAKDYLADREPNQPYTYRAAQPQRVA